LISHGGKGSYQPKRKTEGERKPYAEGERTDEKCFEGSSQHAVEGKSDKLEGKKADVKRVCPFSKKKKLCVKRKSEWRAFVEKANKETERGPAITVSEERGNVLKTKEIEGKKGSTRPERLFKKSAGLSAKKGLSTPD